jgi:hypothetical protein
VREVRGGVLWMEIKLDRKNSEKEENGEGNPRTHLGSFYYEEKSPKAQKY